MVPNPNFDVPVLEYRIPLDSVQFISLYFAQFELEIPLESSYLACKSIKFKITAPTKAGDNGTFAFFS